MRRVTCLKAVPQDRRAPAASDGSDQSEAGWRVRVAGYAESMQAFDPSVFQTDDDRDGSHDAALAAGALILASTMLASRL
jgi:hypothetical protein